MKLTIFAATGGIGRQILGQAIDAGHRRGDEGNRRAAHRRRQRCAHRDRALTHQADKPMTGTYRTAHGQNLRHGIFISRANVAHYMLRALEQPETIKQTIGIAS